MMFFNLHPNAIIGYKVLSDADLGINFTSHQTHIGLYADTLNFITNYHQESTAQLIYEDSTYETVSFLDPIRNPNGTPRSPKIRMGSDSELKKTKLNSIGKRIREIAKSDIGASWYLLWFGLENEELVFFFIKENSYDFHYLNNKLDSLDSGRINPHNQKFQEIIDYLNTKINNLNLPYFQELELLTQTDETILTKRIKPRRYDIQKAQKLFQKIGKEGELYVNNYLEKEKHHNQIKDFNWVNKNSESGFPFDFEITNNSGELFYSDAKSTSYKFEQKIIFSSQELKFIQQNNNYLIHRVFDLNNQPKLKICNNISTISHNFVNNLNNFTQKIAEDKLHLNGMKVSINPNSPQLHFNQEINL